MRFLGFVLSIVIAATVLAPASGALGQAGVATATENRFQNETAPALAEIVEVVIDFPPGAWLPLHFHGGPGYATVLEGTLIRRSDGVDRSFGRGDGGWVDRADVLHRAGNDSATPARIVATFVLPKGATLTTVVETDAEDDAAPTASTIAELRFDAAGLPSPMDLVHRVVDLAPGAEWSPGGHPGVAAVTMLQGGGTLVEAGAGRPLTAGESWFEQAGASRGGTLRASGPVRLVVADLLPRGAALTVPARGPAPVQLPVAVPVPVAR